MDIEGCLGVDASHAATRLLREVVPLRRAIAEYSQASLFREVGIATMLPLGSPVLQRRNGYGEILATWLKFNVATKLEWAGGEDVFGAGKKDVALLYEYWLFFVLLDVVSDVFQVELPAMTPLLEPTMSGF